MNSLEQKTINQLVAMYKETLRLIDTEDADPVLLDRIYEALAKKIAEAAAVEGVKEYATALEETNSDSALPEATTVAALLLMATVKGKTLKEWVISTNHDGLNTTKTIANIQAVSSLFIRTSINNAKLSVYEKAGVKKVRYKVNWNPGTCNICKPDDGKVYDIGKGPSIPRHPNCRCEYVPVV